jgi:hypothetical protein
MTQSSLIEAIAQVIRNSQPCGLTNKIGDHVFCDDESLDGLKDGYGNQLRDNDCWCKKEASLALQTLCDYTGLTQELLEQIRNGEAVVIRKDNYDFIREKINILSGAQQNISELVIASQFDLAINEPIERKE